MSCLDWYLQVGPTSKHFATDGQTEMSDARAVLWNSGTRDIAPVWFVGSD